MNNRHGDLYDLSYSLKDNTIMAASDSISHNGVPDKADTDCGVKHKGDIDDVNSVSNCNCLIERVGSEKWEEASATVDEGGGGEDQTYHTRTSTDHMCNSLESSPEAEEYEDAVSANQALLEDGDSGRTDQPSPPPPPSSASSGFSDDDSLHFDDGRGMTLEEFIEHVRRKGKKGLYKDYSDIKSRSPEGSFECSRLRSNLSKNRYTDVLCFDHSRVILSLQEGEMCSDYINANYVDGYKQKNAFISTQGPLPKTFSDFWRMVWEQQVLVVVMTTRAVERGRTKCGQYWPLEEDGILVLEDFQVKNKTIEQYSDYTITFLELTHLKTQEVRDVAHFQFTSWPDYGVPHSALAMLDFLQKLREQQAKMVAEVGDMWAGHPLGPPIVVHCSAGIGRTGTLCTLDIGIRRIEDVGSIDVQGTVEKIRSQRAYSIQMPDQYVFCHLALIEYALNTGLVEAVDLSGFDDDDDASDSE